MPSHLTTEEVNRAGVGPRELKDPRSRDYAIQTVWALKRYLESRTIDDRRVQKELAAIETYRHWEVLGYPSRDALLEAEVGRTLSQIHDVCEQARQQGALPANGAIGRGRNRCDVVTPISTRGNDSTYLARRLLRDAPDIFAALERGEYASVRAAARAAGLIKDKTPLEQLHHWWGKASAQEREQFRSAIAL